RPAIRRKKPAKFRSVGQNLGSGSCRESRRAGAGSVRPDRGTEPSGGWHSGVRPDRPGIPCIGSSVHHSCSIVYFGGTMSELFVKVEVRGRVGLLTLNRPQVLNALSNEVIDELSAAVRAFEADDGIGAMVLTGSQKAFAAGADISAMSDWTYMDVYKADYLGGNWDALRRIRKPIIAAVSGYALGGGCELAMLCDFIIAAENAKFGQPEIKLGAIPGYGGTQRLPRAVGKAKAMDRVLTARMMDAAEAERAGLVSRVGPVERLLDEALEAAGTIASMSLPAVMMAKECVNRAYEASLDEGLLFERRNFHALFSTEDQKEGMRAFVEKRKPEFKHR